MEIDGHFTKRRQERHVMEVKLQCARGWSPLLVFASCGHCAVFFVSTRCFLGAGAKDGTIQSNPKKAVNKVFMVGVKKTLNVTKKNLYYWGYGVKKAKKYFFNGPINSAKKWLHLPNAHML